MRHLNSYTHNLNHFEKQNSNSFVILQILHNPNCFEMRNSNSFVIFTLTPQSQLLWNEGSADCSGSICAHIYLPDPKLYFLHSIIHFRSECHVYIANKPYMSVKIVFLTLLIGGGWFHPPWTIWHPPIPRMTPRRRLLTDPQQTIRILGLTVIRHIHYPL